MLGDDDGGDVWDVQTCVFLCAWVCGGHNRVGRSSVCGSGGGGALLSALDLALGKVIVCQVLLIWLLAKVLFFLHFFLQDLFY